jgi:hypothetical protein
MSKRWFGALAAIAALCGHASAQDWPNRPIHVIVPYTPGSASDIMPRTIFAKVQERLGQPIIIENRAGAASTLGTGAVAKAEPDGYTFLATSSAFTTVPLTFANLPYEPLRDFAAVIPLVNMANVLVVSPEKAKTLPEFIKVVRTRKDVNYVTIGPGSAALRALSACRRLRSATRRLQGRAGRPDRRDDRPCRLLFQPAAPRAAADPRLQARRSSGQQHGPGAGIARRADHQRSRFSQL